MENQYIISGGQEGKSRLNVLSETLYPYTLALFKRLGVAENKTFLDIGCGGGNVTLLASNLVGPNGKAAGLDFDADIINLARSDAQKQSIHNASFFVQSAYDLDIRNEYDFTYARFLLSHLESPFDVLDKMVRSVKPGGMVIVEDTHFSGHLCFPKCDAFDLYVDLFKKAAFNNGHNPEIGPSLFGMVNKAGLKSVEFDVVLPCFNKGIGKWMAYLTLDRIKQTLIKQGLASEQQVTDMLQELYAFTEDERTIISLPHIFRAWGVRP